MSHHAIFERFTPFEGMAPAGFEIHPSGMLFEQRLLNPDLKDIAPGRQVKTAHPTCSGEGYFDLIAVATAVDRARDKFTMIELGAGYGLWLSLGGSLARQRGLKIKLVGVEAEPGHFKLMQRHVSNNGLLDEADLIEAAATPTDGVAYFEIGLSLEWWGQSTTTRDAEASHQNTTVSEVRGISLQTLIKQTGFVDVVHMDVQGSELDILRSAFEVVDKNVGMIIVGTHSTEIENGLRSLFKGWRPVYDYTIGKTHQTDFGSIEFGDGLQVWSNVEADRAEHLPTSWQHNLLSKLQKRFWR